MKPFIPAILWAIFITSVSVMPGKNLPEIPLDLVSSDKFAHALVYMILVLTIFWGFSRRGSLGKKEIILAICVSCTYGILMEVVQYLFFPGRYFEFLDIIANIIGSIASLLFIFFFK